MRSTSPPHLPPPLNLLLSSFARTFLPPSLVRALSNALAHPSRFPAYYEELEQIYRAVPSVWIKVFFAHRAVREGVKAAETALEKVKSRDEKRGRRWMKKVPVVKRPVGKKEAKAEERYKKWIEALATLEKSGPFPLLRVREQYLDFVLAHTAANPADPTAQEIEQALIDLPRYPYELDMSHLRSCHIRIERKDEPRAASCPWSTLLRSRPGSSPSSKSSKSSAASLLSRLTRSSSATSTTPSSFVATSITYRRYLESPVPARFAINLDGEDESDGAKAKEKEEDEDPYTFPFLLRTVLPYFDDPVAPHLRHLLPPGPARERELEKTRREEAARGWREKCLQGWPW
ncbi:hypothetical protein JCM6882_003172 [Rhodosporidiobolus microsporus]